MKKSFIEYAKKHMKGGWPEDDRGYRVNVGRYSYYVRISAEKDIHGKVTWYTMDIGGRKRGCVSIRVPTMELSIPGTFDAKEAVLKYVKYDPMCSANADRDFVSGFGTKHMLKTALYFAKELCPNTDIQSFRFIDTSRKLCTDGVTIDLPYIMIALNGKTYYEKYFYARLQKDVDYSQYKQALTRLNYVPQDTFTFDSFASKFSMTDSQANSVKELYNSATTFKDFFTSIRDRYPDTVCQGMERWVKDFVIMWVFSNDDLTERTWIIPADKVPDIDIENWEVIARDSVEMNILNREQQGGEGDQYLGLYDPIED